MEPDVSPHDALEPEQTLDQQQQQQQQDLEPLACVSCRSRKLKCDRTRPACTRCNKIQAECVYPESRRKPTFRRRNVKELEARLAQVEDYLKDVVNNQADEVEEIDVLPPATVGQGPDTERISRKATVSDETPQYPQLHSGFSAVPNSREEPLPDARSTTNDELMHLGISETLPPFEMMEELNNIFFRTHHYYLPVVHPGRYLQAFYGTPLKKPPMCLQYAIWSMASYFHDHYAKYSDVFYQRARQYAEADEVKGSGEYFITLFHAQAYAIIATYEAKSMLFTRAAMTSAKCVRLVQMMGLDRLDGEQDSIPPMLGPPESWLDKEERRRSFWGAFAIDAHASISTGWPSLISSDDVTTRLPASEEAFVSGREESTAFLDEVFGGAAYDGFAATIVVCRLFKGIMHHAHRAKPNDQPGDVAHGNYWTRHRRLDNDLSSAFMFLPARFRLPQNTKDPVALHTNLNLHASVMSLHHAAVEMADKYGLPGQVKAQSICRLRASAEEVVSIIKMTAHQVHLFKSPLSALSLYCAATVYILFAKEPDLGLTPLDKANLESIVAAMEAISRTHQITRAFLQQCCLDVERNGLGDAIRLPSLARYRDLYGGPTSNIPMLARSAVGKHTEVSPVLPGRLPLGNPKGSVRDAKLTMPQGVTHQPMDPISRRHHSGSGGSRPGGQVAGFAPFLAPVNRNLAPKPGGADDARHPHKRKRMSPSPAPASRYASSDEPPATTQPLGFTLPDRTSPADSASAGRVATLSGDSSGGSPALGLGNTREENRVDLRALQDRIATPVWEATEEDLMDSEWIRRALSEDNAESWSFLMGMG